MKRIGDIIEEITTYSNINESIKIVLSGKQRKQNKAGRTILENKEEFISELAKEISTGEYRVKRYQNTIVTDGYKEREVQSVSYRDRIAVNAIMSVVEDKIHRTFIRTTGASIKNRGTTDLFKYIQQDINNDREGTEYCLKIDVQKFYASIDHEVMKKCIRHCIKETKLLAMLDNFITMMPKGLSIGLRSSQCLGNLLLSYYIDHEMKDRQRVKYYYRYCDDIVILSNSKKELWKLFNNISEILKSIKLNIKPNYSVFPTKTGIDFLGYVIRPDYARLRKRNKKRFVRRFSKVKSKRRKRELIASFYSITKHANCVNLFRKATKMEIKQFSELGVKYTPADGKKIFKGAVTPLRQLTNLEITVVDCEFGIKTRQGEDRCVVSFEHNGQISKFFTTSKEMIGVLEQITEQNMFPFRTKIEAEVFDSNKTKYMFT